MVTIAEQLIAEHSGMVEGFKVTKGMKKAYERLFSSSGVKKCGGCGTVVPRYPGRYPRTCPHCSGALEDLQNTPMYSERKKKEQSADSRKINAQMRRIPQDRIPR